MKVEPNELGNRLRDIAGFAGAVLTEEELSHIAERYPHCPGKDPWDVRAYAWAGTVGGREYRVVRGGSTQEVFRTHERDRADAVRMGLNELEAG